MKRWIIIGIVIAAVAGIIVAKQARGTDTAEKETEAPCACSMLKQADTNSIPETETVE